MQWAHQVKGLARIWVLGEAADFANLGRQVAESLSKYPCFRGFDKSKFRDLETVEDFNTALADLYDYADDHRIWIDPSVREVE